MTTFTKLCMKDYSNYLIRKFSDHARRVTVAEAKAVRLRVRNIRRKKNGLPPKATYAEI